MSLILDTYETNTWISHLSEDARKHLVIICPYLKINGKLRRTLEVADSKGVDLYVIYGKRELDDSTMTWLKGLRHSNIASIKDLHAKLYMNEEFAVISSMNLYEYSQVNNEELGVLCGRKEDRQEYKDIIFQVMRLIGISEKEYGKWNTKGLDKPIRGLFGRGKAVEEFKTYSNEPSMAENEGDSKDADDSVADAIPNILCHCIRCGRVIPPYHEFVYCGRCMESWRQYSNMGYIERDGHCYICGKTYQTSAGRPACPECYGNNVDLVRTKCDSMRKIAEKKG